MKLPNTGQAVITDIGEGNSIHPRQKEEVGRRMARRALSGITDLQTWPAARRNWIRGTRNRGSLSSISTTRAEDSGASTNMK